MKTMILAIATLSLFTSVASAQSFEETRCRSDASVYSAPANSRGTASGISSDYVCVFDKFGNLVFFQTVAWCINHPGNPYIYQVVANSGGQFSVRLNLYNFANLNGGSYAVWRNGSFVDIDAIV
jgi:hypothetical protein